MFSCVCIPLAPPPFSLGVVFRGRENGETRLPRLTLIIRIIRIIRNAVPLHFSFLGMPSCTDGHRWTNSFACVAIFLIAAAGRNRLGGEEYSARQGAPGAPFPQAFPQ